MSEANGAGVTEKENPMPTASQFAVQSYCFRGFKDNAKTASLVKEIGLDAIEVCGVHADFNDESSFDDVIKTYDDAGVKIISIGVEMIRNDEAAARKRFEFNKRIGAKVMSVNFAPEDTPDCYRLAEKLADEYDINLGIHNHGGYHWLGSTQMLKHVFDNTSPRIGLCLDTAWALAAGRSPVSEYVDLAGDRLYSVHVKDFVFGRDRTPEDVVVGTGNIDLPAFFKQLDAINFRGPAILEYEGDVDNPAPALAQCVKAMKALA